jgi:hypothetical protein
MGTNLKRVYLAEILMIIGTLLSFAILFRHFFLSILLPVIGLILILVGTFLEYTEIKWYWFVIFIIILILMFLCMFFMLDAVIIDAGSLAILSSRKM